MREQLRQLRNSSGMKHLATVVLTLALPGRIFAQAPSTVSASTLPLLPCPRRHRSPARPVRGSRWQAQSAAQVAPGTPTILSVKDAQALALKNNPQISVARLSALASQQVTREVRSSLWPTARDRSDRSRYQSRQSHYRRSTEQSRHLPARCGGRDGESTHHGLRTHNEPGRERELGGQGGEPERLGHERADPAGSRSGLLQRSASAGGSDGGGADGEGSPDCFRPGRRVVQEQAEVGTGFQFCQRQSGAGETPSPGRAEQSEFRASVTFGGIGLCDPAELSTGGRYSPLRRAARQRR